MALTPPTAKRGLLWFEENKERIKRDSKSPSSWWNTHTEEVTEGMKYGLSELLRKLDDFGYKKEQTVLYPGEFRSLGGIVDIFPINTKTALRIEFSGNIIERIIQLKDIENVQPHVPIQKIIAYREHVSSAETLVPGAYAVHIDHGIGKLRATEKHLFNGEEKEYFVLEYAGGDTLYVPIGLTNKVSPYVGFGSPVVHRLGGNLWEKIKRKAKEDLIKTAKELAHLYAERDLAERMPYINDHEIQESLAQSFQYIETRDQKRAIYSVICDMEKQKPMDRLVCGDVGFGKTEVAVRAVAKAVFSGKQAVVLSPTTILAWQHYNTFTERLSKFPMRITTLSRIQTAAEQKQIVRGVAAGEIDVIVGTHRILSKDITFKNLGLLVIDEEQRFGVHQKEKLKRLRTHIDILSLSATPIPRTLSFALAGFRDISIIHTPPSGRMPIKTVVEKYSRKIVEEAIENEIQRKGQVYILHNRISTIYKVGEEVQKMFPKMRVCVAHAKLPEQELISSIDSFKRGEVDILIATTIIENGLDVKNVNTLIVDDATRLGLSQAHQIRGRIGRSNSQAYAYLLYPEKSINDGAKERLYALRSMQYLGAGYNIAVKDLEMRGAGNFLGRDQSGTVNKIGFNLYCQMLQEAIEEIKTGDLQS